MALLFTEMPVGGIRCATPPDRPLRAGVFAARACITRRLVCRNGIECLALVGGDNRLRCLSAGSAALLPPYKVVCDREQS